MNHDDGVGRRRGRLHTSVSVLILGAGLCLAACDGENIFTGGGAGGGGSAPAVEILQPVEGMSVPRGDSVRVEVHVRDREGIAGIQIMGFAERGNKDLGTDVIVPRYELRSIDFEQFPDDTTIVRYLKPTADTTSEPIVIAAIARDRFDAEGADTVHAAVGGPRVQILYPERDSSVTALEELTVKLVIQDRYEILEAHVVVHGAFDDSINVAVQDADTIYVPVPIPAGALGRATVVARARNALDLVGTSEHIPFNVVAVVTGDQAAPGVVVDYDPPARLELTDSIRVSIAARDNSGGSGIRRVGVTVLAFNHSARHDTIVVQFDTTFARLQGGSVPVDFAFTPVQLIEGARAATGPLSVPDTLTLQVHGFAVDEAGNCGASVGTAEQRLACTSVHSGTVATGVIGSMRQVMVVAGKTVKLPGGGTIADAVVDVARRRLYLSNIARNAVEVLDLTTGSFWTPGVMVGSMPWGMTLDLTGDTLIVANSGGTNISFIDLVQPRPTTEVVTKRLRTPNTLLHQITTSESETGLRYKHEYFGFSDRPQFIAQDARGRLLYSALPTPTAPAGTLRFAVTDPYPAAAGDTAEVRILIPFDAVVPAEQTIVILNIDDLTVIPQTIGEDRVILTTHRPGYPGQKISSSALTLPEAVEELATTMTSVLASMNLLQDADLYVPRAVRGRWDVDAIAFGDTTFVAASGDRWWVAFGEGASAPTGRVIMWDAANATTSSATSVEDLLENASERVLGIGLNLDGSLGVVRGLEAGYFFSPDLRLQGQRVDSLGLAAGAALHPNHREYDYTGIEQLAFFGTGENSIVIVHPYHYLERGEIEIRDNIVGPLRAALPFPEDNPPATCPTPGSPGCVVVNLYGITSAGGVVIVPVRQGDLRQ